LKEKGRSRWRGIDRVASGELVLLLDALLEESGKKEVDITLKTKKRS